MIVVHLTASTFYGGPERQMLGLARALADHDTSVFLSFSEGGRCRAFLGAARRQGFEAVALANDTPRLRAAAAEVTAHLDRLGADVLCCHGYKSDLLGRSAARRAGIPAVAVARGWTGENFKVRVYEVLDRCHLRWMDHVVCVSETQAAKVRKAGVRAGRVSVIRNAIDPERFVDPDPRYRTKLLRYFRSPRGRVIGAAGRLSPEKGFDVLVAAAERVARVHPEAGFILFGDGPCRASLLAQIKEAGLAGTLVLSGFRADLDRFVPHLDLLVLPSYTEGLPNVVLEACAAGVPVVATAVGGTPEVIEDGVSGFLVPPGDPEALAGRIGEVLSSGDRLQEMGFQGRQRILEHFSFAAQAGQYRELFARLTAGKSAPAEAAEQEPPTPPEGSPAGELVPAEPTCEP